MLYSCFINKFFIQMYNCNVQSDWFNFSLFFSFLFFYILILYFLYFNSLLTIHDVKIHRKVMFFFIPSLHKAQFWVVIQVHFNPLIIQFRLIYSFIVWKHGKEIMPKNGVESRTFCLTCDFFLQKMHKHQFYNILKDQRNLQSRFNKK